jgi:cytoskeleton protein RodZ
MEHTNYSSQDLSAGVNTAMPLPGAALAAARKARGASVEDVARLLKLSVDKVQAIEADDHSQLPAPIFVRGFIRNYAKLLNIDIVPLLPARAPAPVQLDERMLHRVPGTTLGPKRSGRLPAMLAGAAVVLLGLGYYEFSVNPPLAPYQADRSVPVRINPVAPTRVEMSLPPALPTTTSQAARTDLEMPRIAASSDNLQLKKSTDPTSGANQQGLHFLFNGESWVEVRGRDGKVVFSMINAPGSERIVRGDPPFSLVIGGASGVQLSYNGSRVDLASYVNEDVARLRLE